MSSEEIDHIAQLQQKLYARDPESAPKRTVGILRPLKSKVESSWGESELLKEKHRRVPMISGYRKLFVISFIFFLIALGAALFSVYRGAITLSSKNVEVTILGNSFVAGGESLPIQVDMVNKNATDLVDAEITISYPKGSSDATGAEIERVKKSLGTIPSGKTKTEGFSVVLYGEQGTSRSVTATLEYKLAGSNTTFVKEKSFSVMINSSPVSLTVDAPSSTASNQPFNMTIRSVFTGDSILNDVIVRVEYPNGYIFSSASPSPEIGNNVWSLKDLVKGTERTISIKGKLIGEEQDEKSFRVYIGSRVSETDSRIAVSYNSVLHSTTIEQPFISGVINLGVPEGDIVALPSGSSVSGSISFVNNAPIRITNPVFTLSVIGDTVLVDSIESRGGRYDPLERYIVWNNETSLDLASIESGASGELPFSFNTTFPKPGTAGDINLALSISGTFPDRDFFEDSISDIDQKIIRFSSRLQFASQALYSTGPIKNSGPFPPRVEKETTYTILWNMKPVENPLSKAVATAVLPIGSMWTGVIYPQSESISYNPETRVVSWNIGSVPRATSSSATRSVGFQIKVKPTKSQLGSSLDLLGETMVSATDTVANTELSISRSALTNQLSLDPLYSPGKEKVLP